MKKLFNMIDWHTETFARDDDQKTVGAALEFFNVPPSQRPEDQRPEIVPAPIINPDLIKKDVE